FRHCFMPPMLSQHAPVSPEYAERIEKLVSEIQREKAAADGDSKQIALWESQIDDLVYRLYGLTDDHISLINDYCN
uniref:hypothetical protein n=1 Tax=Bacteroides acidifaciens TaxID=85831 RepID=UPI00301481F4